MLTTPNSRTATPAAHQPPTTREAALAASLRHCASGMTPALEFVPEHGLLCITGAARLSSVDGEDLKPGLDWDDFAVQSLIDATMRLPRGGTHTLAGATMAFETKFVVRECWQPPIARPKITPPPTPPAAEAAEGPPPAHRPALRQRCVRALRKKLERWELIHLREHVEDLRQQLEAVTAERDAARQEADRANDHAAWWHDNTLQLTDEITGAGGAVGLTQQGALIRLPAATAASVGTAP